MFKKINDKEYFAYKAISSHSIMSFFFPQDHPKQDPKLFEIGTLVHAKILEVAEIAKEIQQTRCQNLNDEDVKYVDKLVEALNKSEKIKEKIQIGKEGVFTEVAGFKKIKNAKGDVLQVKGKFDLIDTNNKFVLDVKTTSGLKNFDQSIDKFAYHIQAAFYLRLAKAVTKEDYKDFYWAVIDKKTFLTDLIRCPDKLIKKGNYYIDLYLNNPPTFHVF